MGNMGEKHDHKKFPHISRSITALLKKHARKLAPLFIALGIVMIGIANIAAYGKLPKLAKTALVDPMNSATLTQIAAHVHQETAQKLLSMYLLATGNRYIATEAYVAHIKRDKKRAEIDILIREYPQYPDAYAYKALLLAEAEKCDTALLAIQKARKLDPNRNTLQDLEKELETHCK